MKPIAAADARRIVAALHYSGKCDPRSQVHLGVFLDGRCGGAIQLGPPIDKRKALALVPGTPWNAMLDLHRLAFADWLPRNGESRAIAHVLRWIKKTYPWMQWVQSYADAAQCGDGTIYRASGFSLVSIKPNSSMWRLPSGEIVCDIVTRMAGSARLRARIGFKVGEAWSSFCRRTGTQKLKGFQLRYVYFLDPSARARLTVPALQLGEIDRLGAGMYRGQLRVRSAD